MLQVTEESPKVLRETACVISPCCVMHSYLFSEQTYKQTLYVSSLILPYITRLGMKFLCYHDSTCDIMYDMYPSHKLLK